MARSPGISGLAVAMATAGLILAYVGIRDVPLTSGLREMLRGRTPTAREKTPVELPAEFNPRLNHADTSGAAYFGDPGQSGVGARIAAYARSHIGIPYRWGGHDLNGMDCSGLVTYVMRNEMKWPGLPDVKHINTTLWMNWRGARSIARKDCAAGDLVCWDSHIGIATGPDTMVHAPTFFQNVKEVKIWWTPAPVIRRVIS